MKKLQLDKILKRKKTQLKEKHKKWTQEETDYLIEDYVENLTTLEFCKKYNYFIFGISLLACIIVIIFIYVLINTEFTKNMASVKKLWN